VPSTLLMCSRHWRLVPKELKVRIHKTLAAGRHSGEWTDVREWVDAAHAAIAAVAQAEGVAPGLAEVP
jgi:hypothetical protein